MKQASFKRTSWVGTKDTNVFSSDNKEALLEKASAVKLTPVFITTGLVPAKIDLTNTMAPAM